MALNKILSIIFTAIFIFTCSFINAQEPSALDEKKEEEIMPGYFIDYMTPAPRLFQRIVWDPDENASDYEIVIQNINDGSEYHRERTGKIFIELSIPPGSYRYNITTLDFLGRVGETSEWKEFIVLPAYQPVIESFMPRSFFLDQRVERELNISIVNMQEDSQIYLRNRSKELFPIHVMMAQKRVRLFFDDTNLVPGTYDIYIKNPGGLDARAGGFFIGYRKPLDFFMKVLWNSLIPLYGGLKDDFGSKFYFAGGSISFEVMSSRRSTFNGGLELYTTTYFLNPLSTINFNFADTYGNSMALQNGALLTDIGVNIALQKRFYYMMHAVTFRFGVGASVINSFGDQSGSEFTVYFNCGVTGLFLLYELFHIEIGADFSHYMAMVPFGVIKPKIGLVWKF